MDVVLIEELPNHIKNTLLGIQKGLALASEEGGITTDPVMDVQFQLTVVAEDGWQSLDIIEESTQEGEDKQGGGVTETTNDTSNGSDTATTERTRTDEASGKNTHVQNSTTEGQSATSE